MQTIEVSEAAYQRLLSLRNGDESLSKVILREYPSYEDEKWDVEKIDAETTRILNTEESCSLDEVLQ